MTVEISPYLYSVDYDQESLSLNDLIKTIVRNSRSWGFSRITKITEETALLSTGYSKDGKAEEILGRGCDGFIQKPFDIKSLAHWVGTLSMRSSH